MGSACTVSIRAREVVPAGIELADPVVAPHKQQVAFAVVDGSGQICNQMIRELVAGVLQ
jgi:hypothetical protein